MTSIDDVPYSNEACATCGLPRDLHLSPGDPPCVSLHSTWGDRNRCRQFVRCDPPRAAYGSLPGSFWQCDCGFRADRPMLHTCAVGGPLDSHAALPVTITELTPEQVREWRQAAERKVSVPSVNDWAAKAARRIMLLYDLDRIAPQDRSVYAIAAIIATYAEPLVKLLRESERAHYHCEDSWYCCGKCEHSDHGELDSHGGEAARQEGVCNCGADTWNARVDAVLDGGDVT